jgi:hypothetical protein
MTDVEREILNDAFLEPTTEIHFWTRSQAFQETWRKKFGVDPPKRSSFDEALDARIENDVSPSVHLREAVTKLLRSEEGRRELSERDPKWKQKLQASLMEEEAERFRTLCPDYFVSEWNHEVIVDWLARNLLNRGGLDVEEAQERLWDAGLWTAENLRTAYLACLEAGGLQVQPGKMRKLTKQEELEVIAIGQMNPGVFGQMSGVEAAISRFLELSLGNWPDDLNSAAAVVRFQAQNPAVCNTAVLWVFRQLRANGLTDENWNDFAEMVSVRSPLLTFKMLEDAFIEWSRSTKPSPLFSNGSAAAKESREDLDELSDEEIAERLVQARRAAARARVSK